MVNEEPGKETITAFFPAYNDWGTIASMVVLMSRVLARLTDDFDTGIMSNRK